MSCDGIVAHYVDPGEDVRRGSYVLDRQVLALSVAGPSMSIKAIRAGLASNPQTCSFDWYAPGHRSAPTDSHMRAFAGGYRFSQPHRLGFGVFHMGILAKMPSLLHSRTQETLWQHLEKSTTTPIKREWMEWLTPALVAAQKIVTPTLQHGLTMGVCAADDATLDKLVEWAVTTGKVKV